MPRVLITPITLANVDGPHLGLLRAAGFEVSYAGRDVQLAEDELLAELPGVIATIAGSEPYTRRVLEGAPGLRVIARAGVGYDAVDLAAATAEGKAVTITPGTNHDTVAEHTLALLLGLAKNLVAQDRETRAGLWRREPTIPLRGRTLGVVGLGRIGKAVAVRAAAFRMRVLVCEQQPDLEFVRTHQLELVSLDRLLVDADFVSLHIPMSPATRHLMNQQTLGLMKPTAFLINTARGGLVCEAALIDALNNKRLAGAGLDVFEVEPPMKNPLVALDNVLLTPHTAGSDLQSRIDMAVGAAQAIIALSRGQWPAEQVVNGDVKGRFRW